MGLSRSTVFLALMAAGCGGQSVEGAWRGTFPLAPDKPCEIRLLGDRSALLECGGTAVVGAGRYRWDGTNLEIDLTALAYEGTKAAPPGTLAFRVQSGGNALKAARAGQVYEWRRKGG